MEKLKDQYECYYHTPLGRLHLIADDHALSGLHFLNTENNSTLKSINNFSHCRPLKESYQQLEAWFSDKRQSFDVPLSLKGTHFQKKVWQALLQIPFGETRSYSEVAQMVNNPKAVRAVGSANGKNPISIIVPCHRVINKSGQLGGYGGGLFRKRWLLTHEKIK